MFCCYCFYLVFYNVSLSRNFVFIVMFLSLSGWYSGKLPELNAWLTTEVSRLGLSNLSVLPPFNVDDDMLEVDGVHLLAPIGDQYLAHLGVCLTSLLSNSSDVTLVGEVTNLVDQSDSDDEDASSVAEDAAGDRLGAILKIVRSNSRRLSGVRPLKTAVDKLTESTSSLEAQVRLRRQRDNLVFARIKEEADSELNRSRENRVVISGFPRCSASLTAHSQKKDHYSKLIADLIVRACPDLTPAPQVIDVIVNLRRDQANPSIEALFSSAKEALAFRKSASSLAKAQDPDFGHLYFSNSITQATRVRIEVLKAIAKKLSTETENAYVQGFISRPVLVYLSRDPSVNLCSGTGRSYSFTDAVSRYGDLVMASDLASAYKRAGTTFQGAMEQYFVILSEAEDRPVLSGTNTAPVSNRGRGRWTRGARGTHSGSSGFGRGRKRIGENDIATPSKKRPGAIPD